MYGVNWENVENAMNRVNVVNEMIGVNLGK